MAHEVGQLDHGMTAKVAPWHIGETRDRWTITDDHLTALEAAKLGWKRHDGNGDHWNPRLVRVYADAGDGQFVEIPDSFHVVRDDMPTDSADRFISSGRGVGKGFVQITNADIVEFADALMQGGAYVESCGSLQNGRRVFMSLHLPKTAEIVDEPAVSHLLLTTVHDGTECFGALLAPMLTVCNNTLQWNRRAATTHVKIRHSKNAADRLANADAIIKVAEDNFGDSIEIMRRLAQIKIDRETAEKFVASVPGFDPENKRQTDNFDAIIALYNGGQIGSNLDARKETWFGMANAFSQWIETQAPVKLPKTFEGDREAETSARRANSAMFGQGAKRRDDVFNRIVVAAGV